MLNRQMASRVFGATDNFCVRSRINYQYLEQVAATLRLRPIASRVSRRYYHKGHGVLDNDLKIRSMGPAGTSVGENSLRQFTPRSVWMPKASRPRYAQGLCRGLGQAFGALGAVSAGAPVIRRPSTGR
jgi:hypothetical protein